MSQSEAIKHGYKIKFDSEKEKIFIVTNLEGRVVKYPCDDCGLYLRYMLPPFDCYVSYFNSTTVEGYTQHKVEHSGRERKVYHDLSAENKRNVKVWLRSNQAKNAPISVEEINLEKKFQSGCCDVQMKEHETITADSE